MPKDAQPAARQAMKEVFLRNITLPKEDTVDTRLDRALQGMLLTATNKKAMGRLIQEVDQVLQQFLLARNTAYQQIKNSFLQTLGNYTRALEAQLKAKVRLEVEHLPEFQQEWRKFESNRTLAGPSKTIRGFTSISNAAKLLLANSASALSKNLLRKSSEGKFNKSTR